MSPDKKEIIGDDTVEMYWWAGKYVVYVNNHATEETFDEACARLRASQPTVEKIILDTPENKSQTDSKLGS